ncbi:MAG: alpha-glucosidase C-terminal domain-containing protein [Anaerolineales bacterium]|nr:alpha-glucosidase C-terminal domain-containing protein [Anaerolineales bacterium]
MSVPSWVKDAVFYQIFPDRFANGNPQIDPPNVHAWGAPPDLWHFQGGDFQGIIDRFDYLLDLGVNAIYFNPIFYACSNHRYNTSDYHKIDPLLGTMDDFKRLLNIAHSHQVRVILDGVFNHCGRGFFAFNDLLENGRYSAYYDWFHVINTPIDAYSDGQAHDYLAWWGIKSLPKFNTNHRPVRKYLLDVVRYWMETGIDGWRLDVPNEIDDDSFWAEFRHVVKSINPEAYLVGEIWTVDPRWVGPTHFDGVLNYPLRDAILRFIHADTLTSEQFLHKCNDLFGTYPPENVSAMYLTLGSHDTERVLTKMDGNINKVKLAFAFIFSLAGVPGIYYGDEIGLPGGKDPDCRRAFPWDTAQWNVELRDWVKLLIENRKKHPELRSSNFKSLYFDNENKCLAFSRFINEETIVVVMNASNNQQSLKIPLDENNCLVQMQDILGGGQYPISEGALNISLAPLSCMWLK